MPTHVFPCALEFGLSANIVRADASGGVMHAVPPLTVREEEIDLGLDLPGEAMQEICLSDLRRCSVEAMPYTGPAVAPSQKLRYWASNVHSSGVSTLRLEMQ